MQTLSLKTSAKITSLIALAILLSSGSLVAFASSSNTAVTPASMNSNATVKCTDCWAGYGDAVTKTGAVTMITATFTMPKVTCQASNANNQAVGVLAAIDGVPTSVDFLYIGPAAICPMGSSTAVYEVVSTASAGTILSATVKPGDKITETIKIKGTTATYTFKDSKTGTSTGTSSTSGFSQIGAECMTDMFGGYALAKFPAISITNCKATISGSTKAIGGFGSAATLSHYVDVSGTGATLAKASSLNSMKSGFKVTWKAYGP